MSRVGTAQIDIHLREATSACESCSATKLGRQTSAGEWTVLEQDIEGFDQQPGTRHVLRLRLRLRGFVLASAKSDQAANIYVLDTIIESVRVME